LTRNQFQLADGERGGECPRSGEAGESSFDLCLLKRLSGEFSILIFLDLTDGESDFKKCEFSKSMDSFLRVDTVILDISIGTTLKLFF